MKTRLSLIIILTIVTLGIAATLTVDIPSADVPRVSRAFGYLYQLGHDASMPEVAAQTQLWVISQTKSAERSFYNNNYVEQPLVMQPTPTPTPTPTPSPTPTATATP